MQTTALAAAREVCVLPAQSSKHCTAAASAAVSCSLPSQALYRGQGWPRSTSEPSAQDWVQTTASAAAWVLNLLPSQAVYVACGRTTAGGGPGSSRQFGGTLPPGRLEETPAARAR